ncbi:hypothetical protein HaLaN_03300 [Haematococcus lacustris]|uniref:Uncharacterized protein n=1 Tax=Haematococcus lacustris TaxID=44745 RepID=A0A699YNI7_HAELA|nr:hypothetical protein HaLaN_03300 [Haematococcus lacustris]
MLTHPSCCLTLPAVAPPQMSGVHCDFPMIAYEWPQLPSTLPALSHACRPACSGMCALVTTGGNDVAAAVCEVPDDLKPRLVHYVVDPASGTHASHQVGSPTAPRPGRLWQQTHRSGVAAGSHRHLPPTHWLTVAPFPGHRHSNSSMHACKALENGCPA